MLKFGIGLAGLTVTPVKFEHIAKFNDRPVNIAGFHKGKGRLKMLFCACLRRIAARQA